MSGMGPKGRWVIAGALAAALAVAVPLVVSNEVVARVGMPAAIVPTPLASASSYLPLNALANAIGAQGERSAYTDTYSNQYVDVQRGRVLVYVTDLAMGRAMLHAVQRAHPGIDLRRVTIVRATYTMKRLNQAIRHLLAAASPAGQGVAISGVGPAPNGSGIQAMVQVAATAHLSVAAISARLTAAAGGIPVTVSITRPIQSWAG